MDQKRIPIELLKKEVTYLILALRHYEELLVRDEEDAGPSWMDAQHIRSMLKIFEEMHARF